jgi:SOS-response transcriptional repressor LexA
VEVPDWVGHVVENNYDALYPEEEGGFIGVGIAESREEAISAAAVDLAGSISTEVEAEVAERTEQGAGGDQTREVVIESEVRSRAIVSGLRPRVWADPRTEIFYALFRTTSEEYTRRLAEWNEMMGASSEAERQQEIRRLQEEQAAAERRQEEIELAELQEEIRRAERALRAERHRAFLQLPLPAREHGISTPYSPLTGELTVGADAAQEYWGSRLSYERALFRIFRAGVDVGLYRARADNPDLVTIPTSRLGVLLIDRAGAVRNISLSAGLYGGGKLSVARESEWAAGPFASVGVIAPELAHTRYELYAGTDLVHAHASWYPFWRSMQDAVSISVTAQFAFWEWGTILQPTERGVRIGPALTFRPADSFWIRVASPNFTTISGSVTYSATRTAGAERD